jgi:hypothetical protein
MPIVHGEEFPKEVTSALGGFIGETPACGIAVCMGVRELRIEGLEKCVRKDI